MAKKDTPKKDDLELQEKDAEAVKGGAHRQSHAASHAASHAEVHAEKHAERVKSNRFKS